jgi:putative transcriptional regulator
MKTEDFDLLMTSVKQGSAILRGDAKPSRVFEYQPADVKRIRSSLHQSQVEFAQMIGVSVSTLRNWEQGRRVPEGPARALLMVAARNPKAVAEALKHAV